eukprot:403332866
MLIQLPQNFQANPGSSAFLTKRNAPDLQTETSQVTSQFGYQYTFLENQLIEAVKQSIRNELYANASFLCERLFAEVKNEDVKLLLAECYLGEGKAYKAYEVLKNSINNANRYKFALTCFKLNKLQEAEKTLLNRKSSMPLQQQDQNSLLNQVPNGAAGLFLLGQICERQIKRKEAVDFYQKALQQDPTLWCAFERLCKLQMNIEPSRYFHENHPNMQKMNQIIKEYMIQQQQQILNSQNTQTQIVINNHGIQQSPSHSSSHLNIQSSSQQQFNLQFNAKSPFITQKSPSNQEMKENQLSASKKPLITGEDLNNSSLICNDDDSSFQNELKTPTGQSSGQYITPTSNMNQVPTKKLGQNAPAQTNHQSRIGNAGNNNNSLINGSGMGQVGAATSSQLNYQIDNVEATQSVGGGTNIFANPNNLINNNANNNINTSTISSGNSDPIIKPFTISTPNLNNMNMPSSGTGSIGIPQQFLNQMSNTPISSSNGTQNQAVSSFDANQMMQQSDDRMKTSSFLANTTSIQKNKKNIMQQQQQLGQMLQTPQQTMNLLNLPPTSSQSQPNLYNLQALLQSTQSVEITDLTSLLRVIGHAYQQLCLYRCQESVKIFGKLSKKQYTTGWVLAQVGKCYFEMSKYTEAEKFYKKVLNVEPYRLEGLEYYSTCLWHLRKQVDLCYLSNHALEKSLFAPETWCVVGNCYSLQKEHETALKFFSRAIQLNGNFAYAHTLSGHEYVSNEDFDQAKKCYQKALTVDERHYNAWWGLGNICLKQEKFDQAAQLFTSAVQINQRSSILFTYLGMTKHNCAQPGEALQYFEKSEQVDPTNSLNKFQKANVLISLDRNDEALQVLLELLKNCPREAPIHVVIGRLYRKMGNIEEALKYFTKALDLDPKDTNMVKSLIDKIHSQAGPNGALGGNGMNGGGDLNDDGDIQIL